MVGRPIAASYCCYITRPLSIFVDEYVKPRLKMPTVLGFWRTDSSSGVCQFATTLLSCHGRCYLTLSQCGYQESIVSSRPATSGDRGT